MLQFCTSIDAVSLVNLAIRITTPRTLLQAGVRGLLRDLYLFDILSK